jgi:hypothetical protein
MLVNILAVMGDVFASVYNFHSPLSSKVDFIADFLAIEQI